MNTNLDKPLDLTKPVQTRDGRKVLLLGVLKKSRTSYPLITVVTQPNGEEVLETYTLQGYATLASSNGENSRDLVNVPEKHQAWINLYPHGGGSLHTSRERADSHALCNRIACVKVEYTEGQGL